MNNPEVYYERNCLYIDNHEVRLNFEISDAFILKDMVIVLYDPDCNIQKFGQFANIEAFSIDGHKLWTVELPTTDSGDRYYQISSKKPLIADSIYSFQCFLNPATGKIRDKVFLK